jgi:phosphopantothenoylcysteine decarboxylase/phosphopantothenate--cysteine ligase
MARSADIVIMAAAVADFRAEKIAAHKIKKTNSKKTLTLRLRKNSDILSLVSKNKRKGQIVVGFALETENVERNAAAKLREKGCDFIVANKANVIGKKDGRAVLISRLGPTCRFKTASKASLARSLLAFFISEGRPTLKIRRGR